MNNFDSSGFKSMSFDSFKTTLIYLWITYRVIPISGIAGVKGCALGIVHLIYLCELTDYFSDSL